MSGKTTATVLLTPSALTLRKHRRKAEQRLQRARRRMELGDGTPAELWREHTDARACAAEWDAT